jgi:hypothetical protein
MIVIQAGPQMGNPEYIIGEGPPKRPKPVRQKEFDPLSEPMGYQWPASRLSWQDMERLCELRSKFRKPITALLQDAVGLMWTMEQSLEGVSIQSPDESNKEPPDEAS